VTIFNTEIWIEIVIFFKNQMEVEITISHNQTNNFLYGPTIMTHGF